MAVLTAPEPHTIGLNDEDTPNMKKRSRNLSYCKNSCLSCRSLHAKCSGDEPKCNGCAMRGIECVYVKAPRKRAKLNNADQNKTAINTAAVMADVNPLLLPTMLSQLPGGPTLAMPMAPQIALNVTGMAPMAPFPMFNVSGLGTPPFQQIQHHMSEAQLQVVFWREAFTQQKLLTDAIWERMASKPDLPTIAKYQFAFSKFIVAALSPSFGQALEFIGQDCDPSVCLAANTNGSLFEALINACRALLLHYVGQYHQALDWLHLGMEAVKRNTLSAGPHPPLALYCLFLLHYVAAATGQAQLAAECEVIERTFPEFLDKIDSSNIRSFLRVYSEEPAPPKRAPVKNHTIPVSQPTQSPQAAPTEPTTPGQAPSGGISPFQSPAGARRAPGLASGTHRSSFATVANGSTIIIPSPANPTIPSVDSIRHEPSLPGAEALLAAAALAAAASTFTARSEPPASATTIATQST